MIVGIRQIIFTIILMYPSRLVKIFQTFHYLHRSVQFHHVIFQFPPFTKTATSIIDIGLSIVVHKNTRIDQRVHSFYITFYLKPFGRLTARSHSDFPAIIPIRSTRMRKIKIIGSILICTIRCPHKTSFLASPRYLS